MLPRLLLVIGSQCDILNKLDFLPEVAERLHALLRHPGPGGCDGIPLEGAQPGLLLDPTVHAAKGAIKTAIKQAADKGATLILAYIGHGEFPDEMTGDFYLMPKDATAPTAEDAIDFKVYIKDCIKNLQNRGSLIVLVDTCHAGAGAWQAMKEWAQSLRGNIDFELLTATDDRATADAPLSRAVIELLRRGDPDAPARIRCQDVHRLLRDRNRPTQHAAFNPDDVRLGLGRNLAHDPGDVFWKDSPGSVEILRHTWYFQPTPQLAVLVEASRSHPVVVLTGKTGSGKTGLAAALARPELTDQQVPDRFVHAIAILTRGTNQRGLLVDDLDRQLRRTVTGFADAVDEFKRSVPLPQREELDPFSRMVLRPLAYLAGRPVVRIIVDGFDQLSDFMRESVGGALASRPGHLHLIITTAWPQTTVCPPGYMLDYGATPRNVLENYLARRRVPGVARPAILDRADGHWLIATLLAKAVLDDPAIDLTQLPGTVNEAYTTLLDQAGAGDDKAWHQRFRPVLGPLAVTGAGWLLPLSVLVHVSRSMGGPEGVDGVREVLGRLHGLVVRRDAGEPSEQVGLFHATLAEYFRRPPANEMDYTINEGAVHCAMVQAIETLAPMAEHDQGQPLHRYAFFHEADHLWALGNLERLIACLRGRVSNIPRENLEHWRQWSFRLGDRYGTDHRIVIESRSRLAHWTGTAGAPQEASRLFRELLPVQQRVLGPEHPDTLWTRRNIARWTGEAGDAASALRLLSELLPDVERVLGRAHLHTLSTRHDLAHWVGEAGQPREALRLFRELLPDQQRVQRPDHPDTLGMRHDLARWVGEAEDPREALRLFRELLPDRERVQGPDHPDTFSTRHDIARWAGEAGQPREALRLLTELLPDQQRVLGRDHPDSLHTRRDIAWWTGEAGDARGALRLLSELLPDMERVLGRDHPDTLRTRHSLAHWAGAAGDARGALRLFSELLPDMERVLGRDHPDSPNTRHYIARWTGEAGDARGALRLFSELLPDMERVLGRDHPNTLRTRYCIARWTGKSGDARGALRLLSELLPDVERVLGPDHPDTLRIRYCIARWAGEAGDAGGALRLFRELLPDQQRVQGRDHRHTLSTRHDIARWADEAGQPREALRLLAELLPDRERVLGRDHPATLSTRHDIARWTGEVGDPRGAVRLFRELLPDRERVLGRDHPNTLSTRHDIARWTGEAGDPRGAVRLFRELLPDRERVLGRDHPNTLSTRHDIARWTGEAGDPRGAVRLFRELLPDRERVLGRDHPDTLSTRHDIARWTGEAGDPREALRLSAELLPAQERVLGRDHPATLSTRHDIARWAGVAGDAREALCLFRELLPDQQRVQGPDHPATLWTRHDIALWTGELGEPREALQLFRELLSDRERVQGPDHPDTLNTLSLIGTWAIRNGDQAEGCRRLHEGLTRAEARFGLDHPSTQKFQDAIRNFGCEESQPGAPVTPGPG